MRNLIDFSIMHEYNKNVLPRGDKLLSIAGLVDWKRFSAIGDGLYKNNTGRGGKPNIDIIIIIKLLLLQEMFGLSDPQLELQVADRISFRVFLGTTETMLDFTTVWPFRKRLEESGKYNDIWGRVHKPASS